MPRTLLALVAGALAPYRRTRVSVPAARGTVLAEMTRRLGTPRRVALEARRHAPQLARLTAPIRAREAAAHAESAAAAAAAWRAASRPSYWFDSQAAVANTSPSSPGRWLAGDPISRWQVANRSADGFVARHYPGL